MSLSIPANDHGGFALYRGDEHVGWVEGRAVALVGYETLEPVVLAA